MVINIKVDYYNRSIINLILLYHFPLACYILFRLGLQLVEGLDD